MSTATTATGLPPQAFADDAIKTATAAKALAARAAKRSDMSRFATTAQDVITAKSIAARGEILAEELLRDAREIAALASRLASDQGALLVDQQSILKTLGAPPALLR